MTPGNIYTTFKIISGTSGTLQIDNFKANSSVNPLVLNPAYFENCNRCKINLTFTGSPVVVDDLKFNFLGSKNFTATATYSTLSDSKLIQVYYSDFNESLPKGVNYYDVFPASKDAKNVSPYKQTDFTPIWNTSNFAYDERTDIYVRTNGTNVTWVNSCLNVTYLNNSNQSSPANLQFKLNNSYQKILSNLSVNFNNPGATSKGIWNYWDLTNCSSRFMIPYVYFASICTDCYLDKNQLDNLNIITG